eukprot:7287102-Pyramimonas_sp.AAC.1
MAPSAARPGAQNPSPPPLHHKTNHASRDPRETALSASDGARQMQEIRNATPVAKPRPTFDAL